MKSKKHFDPFITDFEESCNSKSDSSFSSLTFWLCFISVLLLFFTVFGSAFYFIIVNSSVIEQVLVSVFI